MVDGYDNWLADKIDDIKRCTEHNDWDEYLAGRQSGFESSLASYREYIRRSNL